jgi:hypothetical protein
MPQEYQPAPEVEEVARRLINDFHSHLATVRIDYVFTTEQLKEKGKVVWGRAKKVTGLNAWLASEDKLRDAVEPEEFFVMEIHRATWLQIDEKSRRALVDHELCHFWVGENGSLSIAAHDLEEFNAVVRRYGLWRADVEFFIKSAKERERGLFDDGDDDRIAGQVLDRVADKINAGALGPDVTASVTKGAQA